ncbi:MAG: hypothetical protein U0Z26_07680 [Anaerolineales bacterium]
MAKPWHLVVLMELSRLWEVKTGNQIGEPLTGHDDIVTSVTFSPDGLNLVSGSADQSVKMWALGFGISIDVLAPRVIGASQCFGIQSGR